MLEYNSQIELSKVDKNFKDISLAFTVNPLTSDITVLRDERAINNSLKNIILFLPSEVPFNRDIGSHTQAYLFELVDEATAGLLSLEIKRAIEFGEPRVTFQPVDPNSLSVRSYMDTVNQDTGSLPIQDDLGVYVTPFIERNEFQVTVKYRIVGTEKVVVVDQILTPTR